MKIILLRRSNPYYDIGASANRFSGLIDGLVKQGVKVSILVTGGYNSYNEFKSRGRLEGQHSSIHVIYGVKTFNTNIWLKRINTYLLEGVIYKLNDIVIKKILKKDTYDFIWLTNDSTILKIFINNLKIFKAITFIELNEFNDIYKERGHTVNNIQLHKAEKENRIFLQAVSKIDLFAIMTNTLFKHYVNFANKDSKFLHLPMTVNLDRFKQKYRATNKESYIAYTGSMNNAKDGVDILIKAFSEISDKFPNIKLKLAGGYHYDMPLQKELIQKLGLIDKIKHVGSLNSDRIPKFLMNATLLVLPRPDSRQARGGFPTKLGEYLASRKPVCATTVGEIPDYLVDGESVYFAEPGSVDSFADAMQRALENPIEAKRIGLNGREVAEKYFDKDIQAKKLYEFLKDNL